MPEQLEDTRTDEASETPKASPAENSETPESSGAEAVATAAEESAADEVEAAAEQPAKAEKAAAEEPAKVEVAAAATATAAKPKAKKAAKAAKPDQAKKAAKAAKPDQAKKAEASAAAATDEATTTTAGKSATTATTKEEAAPSKRTLRQQETMAELAKAKEAKTVVEGRVIGWNKGGYHVAVGEIAAFCPVSQIEIGNPRSPKRYLEKEFSFHVIEIEKGGKRVVLSRGDALKAARKERASQVRSKLAQGAVLDGRVSSITDFGAFVSLGGGIEGLIHVSEISRRRVEHAKELLKSGQRVQVQVIKIENSGKRIGLSMKRLEKDPWKGADERYKPGEGFKGTILRKAEFGLFVEVEPGLEGLVHSSRLALGLTLSSDELEVGKEIEGWVQECSPKRRRLALSMREVAKDDPWIGVADRYEVGSVVKGTVERLASFGAFVEIEPGLTGLLPFSEVSLSPGSNPKRQFHAGKEVTVQVLTVEPGRRRMSLGTETSKAEGTPADFKDFKQQEKTDTGSGLSAMAAAFAKLKG